MSVLYSVAADETGRAVAVGDAERGAAYTCIGCGQAMVARQGSVKVWHYAHKPPLGERCDPDGALHEAAKAMIVQGFTEAQIAECEYRAGFRCSQCAEQTSTNVACPDGSIAVERTAVEGTRSDVVIDRGPDRKPVIVEVVVTHDIESETRRRYQKSGMPVLVIRPDWASVDALKDSLVADSCINVNCPECRRAKERSQQRLHEAQDWAASLLDRLEAPPSGAVPDFRRWGRDKFGTEMYPSTRRRVYRNAAILQGMGFVQAREKLWLFVLRFPPDAGRSAPVGTVFANFGSTEETPIWQDQSALIHWNLAGVSEEQEGALVRKLLRACREAGAEVRLSFYNQHLDPDP